jgi:hypothetical protein
MSLYPFRKNIGFIQASNKNIPIAASAVALDMVLLLFYFFRLLKE